MNENKYREGLICDADDMHLQWRFIGYLKSVIRYARADYFAAMDKRKQQECSLDELASKAQSVSHDEQEQADYNAMKVTLMKALEKLPAEQREIIVLSYWEGKSAREIARGMGIDHKTVIRHKEAAMQQLRKEFGE